MSSVFFDNVENSHNKEKPLNDNLCSDLWLVLWIMCEKWTLGKNKSLSHVIQDKLIPCGNENKCTVCKSPIHDRKPWNHESLYVFIHVIIHMWVHEGLPLKPNAFTLDLTSKF